MFTTQLERLVKEQKKYCPILTSKQEYPQGRVVSTLEDELDENNVLLLESRILDNVLEKFDSDFYHEGMHLFALFGIGFTATCFIASNRYAAMGGLAASMSGSVLALFYPEIKAKYKTRKEIKQMRREEHTKGKSSHRPSYGTSL